VTPKVTDEGRPPAWAESVLRALLEPRNRDSITGDLLEEYCEVVLPARGELRAKVWYIRQVASFVTVVRLIHTPTAWVREGIMFERRTRASWLWLIAGSVALVALLGALNFGPPLGIELFATISIAVGASALISVRSRGDFRWLWRIGLVCGLLVCTVLLARLLVDVVNPVDPLDRLLARVRDDYSVFNYPRLWMPAVAVAVILLGGGLVAAWRTGKVGMGTLTAVTGSAAGSIIYVALVALGNTLPFGPQDPLGNAPRDLQFFGNVPTMLVPVLVMFSTVLGTIGALFGRAISSDRATSTHG